MKFRSKNLLITGGSGFIGSNFINYFLKKYHETNVINLDLLTYAGNPINTNDFENNPRYKFVYGDIRDIKLIENIFKKYSIDGVINFAAETHVDNSIKNPEVFIQTNVNGTFNLLNAAYKTWCQSPFSVRKQYKMARFHQISTDEVYGSIERGSFKESSKYMPNSPYSASKASGDLLVRSFNKTFGLNTTISICSNNYGLNQHQEKLIPKIINCILENKGIPLYGDGNNQRDWINVNDHCSAIDLIFNNARTASTYNIGSKQEYSNIDMINLIFQIMKKINPKLKLNIKYVKDRYGHDFRYSVDTNKIKNDLGWTPFVSLKSGLEDYIISKLKK